MRKALILFVLLWVSGAMLASAQEQNPVEPGDESQVAVTIYNEGSALIRDRRSIDLQAGLNTVNFTDVAALIDATSVSFVSLTDPSGTVVLEQNYVYDLVNSEALLERYLDETIEVTLLTFSGESDVIRGQLLSGRGGDIILRLESGEVVVIRSGNARDIRFPALPQGLITRPTLRWLINSAAGGAQDVELTYLTSGLSWTADYNLLLHPDNTALDLNGWVTLNNTSGTSYENARLKLVAGDVNRVQPEVMYMMEDRAQAAPMDALSGGGVAQREFFEYQLYEVERAVTIGDNETKQVEFVTGTNVPAKTYYVYDGSVPFYGYGGPITDQYYGQMGITDVQNYLEFTTGEEEGLGADLPAGRVRVYQEDVDGAALLIGENRIDHTPEGEDINIYLGNAFDLVGERTQTNFRLVSRSVLQETYEIKLRNRKDEQTMEIRVPERMFRWSNWEILESSTDFEKLNAFTIEFRVDVPPGEEVTITYTVQYSWPR
jgi:hypothetical protein